MRAAQSYSEAEDKHNKRMEEGKEEEKFDKEGGGFLMLILLVVVGTFLWPFTLSVVIWSWILDKTKSKSS